MRNKQNEFDRVGSSQDFSNNEGYQDYTERNQSRSERNFRNSSPFSDGQKSQDDDGMSRSERNDYRTEQSPRPRPGSSTPDRFESRYGSDFASASREQNQNRDGRQFDRYDASMSGSDPYQSRSSANYGAGSSQSERFDARYNSGYGYGAQDDHRNESRFNSKTFTDSQSKFGPHSGKGPKNYKRSDERIHEDVCEALRHHSEIDASEIEVDVKDGLVTLSGTVDSRQVKRMVEDEIEKMSGVTDVKNDLRMMASVDSSKPRWGSSNSDANDYESQSRSSNTGVKTQGGKTSSTSSKSVQ